MTNIIRFPSVYAECEDSKTQEYEDFIAQHETCFNTFIDIGELIGKLSTTEQTDQRKELVKDILKGCMRLRHSVFTYNRERNELSYYKRAKLDEKIHIEERS